MNVRKAIDYSDMFEALDKAVNAAMSQLELYCEISCLVGERPEKSAAMAASKHLSEQYPELIRNTISTLQNLRLIILMRQRMAGMGMSIICLLRPIQDHIGVK